MGKENPKLRNTFLLSMAGTNRRLMCFKSRQKERDTQETAAWIFLFIMVAAAIVRLTMQFVETSTG